MIEFCLISKVCIFVELLSILTFFFFKLDYHLMSLYLLLFSVRYMTHRRLFFSPHYSNTYHLLPHRNILHKHFPICPQSLHLSSKACQRKTSRSICKSTDPYTFSPRPFSTRLCIHQPLKSFLWLR